VFFLLFSNRNFLRNFNLALAKYLQENPKFVPEKCRRKDGKVKRDGYIPTWAKKAVFFRDQGRCVLCTKDISGMLNTCTPHFDHIVPLIMWGVNDPCNLQLLCEQCNLKKSGNSSITVNRHAEWW
jgi:5-methylcytosine-specific restriction endonuclease McrA